MMADTTDKATVDERYEVATSTSNLRVDVRQGSPVSNADVIWAAGLSDSRLGMMLLRLHSEWSSAAKPRKVTPEGIARLIAEMKAQEMREYEHAKERGPQRPFKPAGGYLQRANASAAAWYSNELRLLAQSLKSRAGVIEQLTLWGAMKGIQGETVSAAVHYWLNSVCGDCGGHGFHKSEGHPSLSSRRCGTCHGTGVLDRPKMDGTVKLLDHIDYALQMARNSLKRRLRP
jgi:hypothetical protein